MYINFTEIVKKWGRPKGIIHIGAHLLEEREEYLKNQFTNTIWIEANEQIVNSIPDFDTDEILLNYLITDKDNMLYQFNLTNNGQSSSILDLELHKDYHPHIFVTDTVTYKSKRMDSVIDENNINIDDYDFLNLDIQGAELLAMKSFGELISKFKYIYTEVNTNNLYKDCALISEIDNYLQTFGFKRVETFMTDAEWGDALYIKSDQDVELSKQNLIFDIGAHHGLFTDKCLNEFPEAKLIVVEANQNLYNILQQKYSDNKRVVVLNYLASDQVGIEDFYICDADQISTASVDWVEKSRFSNHNWHTITKQKTVTIDSLIKIFGNPTLVKIDVEGYELKVLQGLTKKVGEICFEWAEEEYEKINLSCKYLETLGYKKFGYIIEDSFLQRPSYYCEWISSEFHKLVRPEEKTKWGMIWTF